MNLPTIMVTNVRQKRVIKMVRFKFLSPKSLTEAFSLLAEYRDKAKIIAGGQGLLPRLKHRQVVPEYLINIKGLTELEYIGNGDNGLKIGALTIHRAIEYSPLIKERYPMLAELEQVLGHVQIRNWGTIGGNLCDATPANDPPPALLALGARVKVASVRGEREMPLDEFIAVYHKPALEPDEILVEIQIPKSPPHTGGVYHKERVRATDAPIAAVAAVVSLDEGLEIVTAAQIVLQSVGPTPIRAAEAEKQLIGKKIQDGLIDEVATVAATEAHPRTTPEYKRQLVKVITRQVVTQAIKRAQQ
jgi:carbon-monoxide dehydrogenase medium subunit